MTTAIYLACKTEECPVHIRFMLGEAARHWPELGQGDTSRVGECEFALISTLESRLVVHALLAHTRMQTRSLFVTQAALASLEGLLSGRKDDLPVYLGAHQLLRQGVGIKVHRGCLALGERSAPVTDGEVSALATARLVVVLEQLI